MNLGDAIQLGVLALQLDVHNIAREVIDYSHGHPDNFSSRRSYPPTNPG